MRPVILGMNNPHSTDPRHALAPYPKGVAGYRLWKMLNGIRPEISRTEYMRVFDRRNLLNEKFWDPVRSRRNSEDLWQTLEGHTVLVLGQAVRNVLWLSKEPPLLWRDHRGVRWCSVPHPSGLNRWYNDPENVTAVGMRLEELYEQSSDAL